MSSEVAIIDQLRSLAYTSISGSYAAVGSPSTAPIRIICFTNNTAGDVLFSTDGANDYLFLAKGSYKLFDVTANKDSNGWILAFPTGTQFYVKESTSPMSGSVYIEMIYGN